MCSRFLDGLELVIKSRLSALETVNYSALVNKAMLVERDVNEAKGNRERGVKRSRFDPNYQKSSGTEYSRFGGQKFQQGRGGSSLQRGEASGGRCSGVSEGDANVCFFCGSSGHIKRNCPKLLNIECFNCQ